MCKCKSPSRSLCVMYFVHKREVQVDVVSAHHAVMVDLRRAIGSVTEDRLGTYWGCDGRREGRLL